MAEYIEREALLERLRFKRDIERHPRVKLSGLQSAIAQVYKFPTADVVEVVHGEWIVAEDDYGICATEFTCSHCKVSLVTSELTDGQFLDMMKYCPNCGAKMDGERKDVTDIYVGSKKE